MLNGLLLGIALTVEPGGLSMNVALDHIRESRKSGDLSVATVTVRGVNRIVRPVVFTAEDHDINFIGEPGAKISGGVQLEGWREIEEGVWETEAPRTESGQTAFFDQLWVDGRRAPCARLPSEGWLKFVAASQSVVSVGVSLPQYVEEVAFDDQSVKLLADVPKADYPYLEIGVICKWSYGLRTLDDYNPSNNVISMRTDFPWQRWKVWTADRTLVAFSNVRSAFDAPGEWFLDMQAGKVRYRPLPGEDLTRTEIVIPNHEVDALLRFQADWNRREYVSNISFRGIDFEYAASETDGNRPMQINQFQAAATMGGAISLEGVRGIVFDACRVAHCAGYGLRFHSGCMSNRVINCRISDPGSGGIWMGADDPRGPDIVRKILRPNRSDSVAFNVVSNCVISGGGRYNPEGVGVCLSHCSDTSVVHNDIYDFYYSGISVGWTWGFNGSVSQRNDIGFNRIWDLGKGVMSDLGGVYTLATSFGTKVHDNVIHDVKSYSYGGWGLYCDEGSEGIVEERNLVWNTTDGGFHQHFGTGCVIRNNIFAFNRTQGAVRMARAVVKDIPCTLHFVNNVIYGNSGPLVGKGVRNVGGVWANNLWYDVRGKEAAEFDGLKWDDWVRSGKETGGVFADPQFVDAEKLNFNLKPDSPAHRIGFCSFDCSAAGSSLVDERMRAGVESKSE